MKFLLVAFDGLRPDMITPDLMPNLFEFSSQAAVFENHRCVFPSETYVNTTSLVTGVVRNTVPATKRVGNILGKFVYGMLNTDLESEVAER
jgi:predicted AlkP superfamily phosphohydrolase/phosphomutase